MSNNLFAEAPDVRALIHQIIGAGSMCWENLGWAGVFDSELAAQIAENALSRLDELA